MNVAPPPSGLPGWWDGLAAGLGPTESAALACAVAAALAAALGVRRRLSPSLALGVGSYAGAVVWALAWGGPSDRMGLVAPSRSWQWLPWLVFLGAGVPGLARRVSGRDAVVAPIDRPLIRPSATFSPGDGGEGRCWGPVVWRGCGGAGPPAFAALCALALVPRWPGLDPPRPVWVVGLAAGLWALMAGVARSRPRPLGLAAAGLAVSAMIGLKVSLTLGLASLPASGALLGLAVAGRGRIDPARLAAGYAAAVGGSAFLGAIEPDPMRPELLALAGLPVMAGWLGGTWRRSRRGGDGRA